MCLLIRSYPLTVGSITYLKKRKDLIQNLSEYGVSVHKEFSDVPFDQLIAEVDSELQILSSAHLQRAILKSLVKATFRMFFSIV